jgi:hypothetical protein
MAFSTAIRASLLIGTAMALSNTAEARVTAFDVTSTAPVFYWTNYGAGGAYERIDAIARFAVDPASPRAQAIVDVDKAPVNAAGEVEFSTEVAILRPVDPARRSSTLFYEVPNRGRNLSFMGLNRATSTTIPSTVEEAGDGFLMAEGYTLVWSGWQSDLSDDLLNLTLPKAEGQVATSSAGNRLR